MNKSAALIKKYQDLYDFKKYLITNIRKFRKHKFHEMFCKTVQIFSMNEPAYKTLEFEKEFKIQISKIR